VLKLSQKICLSDLPIFQGHRAISKVPPLLLVIKITQKVFNSGCSDFHQRCITMRPMATNNYQWPWPIFQGHSNFSDL